MKNKNTTIKDVAHFLRWIKSTKNVETEVNEVNGAKKSLTFECHRRYFRGQACRCWTLKPGIFREKNGINKEHDLLCKSSLRLAKDISKLNSYLEKMVFFQHYGLKTRLLDVTFNPLIALYMACSEDCKPSCKKYNKPTSDITSCDGIVYVGTNTEAYNPKIAELTAKYIFEYEYQVMDVNFHRFAKENKVKEESFKTALFIEPPINNARLEAQDGAFIMAPLINKIQEKEHVIINKSEINENLFFENRRAVIKADNKEKILRELDMCGINSGTIYRDIQEKLKAINKEVQWETDFFKLDT